MRQVKIGGKLVGDGQPVFVIAELGYNFNTRDEALRSVDAAAGTGVDALKIQTFRADTIATQLASSAVMMSSSCDGSWWNSARRLTPAFTPRSSTSSKVL